MLTRCYRVWWVLLLGSLSGGHLYYLWVVLINATLLVLGNVHDVNIEMMDASEYLVIYLFPLALIRMQTLDTKSMGNHIVPQ